MRPIVPLAVALGLLVTVPAMAQGSVPDQAGLTVRGTATVDEKPDTVDFTVSVVTRGPTPEGTIQAHKARIAEARAALDRLKANGATIQSASFGLTEERQPVPPGTRPPDTPPTYRADTHYDIRSKAVGEADALAAAIVSTGLFEFDGVRYSVGDSGAAKDRARRAAMADARHQAEVYADAAGVRLDGIQTIVDGDSASPDGAFDLPSRGARAASVGLSPPASIPFGGSVTVTWRIAPRQ